LELPVSPEEEVRRKASNNVVNTNDKCLLGHSILPKQVNMSSSRLSNRSFFGVAATIFFIYLMNDPTVLHAGEAAASRAIETDRAENGTAPETTANTSGDIPSSSINKGAPRTGADYPLLAREASARMFSQVENVVCQERIQRHKSRHAGESHAVDVIEANVAVENGEERYSDIVQDNRHRQAMQQIGGAWSAGEYATFLREARQVLDSNDLITQGYLSKLNGVPAVLFPFDIDEKTSTWDFLVRSHSHALGFHGELWVSQETGEG
jgi:hypothetical protein